MEVSPNAHGEYFHTDSEMSLLSFRLFEHQVARLTEIPLEMAPEFCLGCLDGFEQTLSSLGFCKLKNSYGGGRRLFQELRTQFLPSIYRLRLLLDFTHLASPLLMAPFHCVDSTQMHSPRARPSFASDLFNFRSLSSTLVPPFAWTLRGQPE